MEQLMTEAGVLPLRGWRVFSSTSASSFLIRGTTLGDAARRNIETIILDLFGTGFSRKQRAAGVVIAGLAEIKWQVGILGGVGGAEMAISIPAYDKLKLPCKTYIVWIEAPPSDAHESVEFPFSVSLPPVSA